MYMLPILEGCNNVSWSSHHPCEVGRQASYFKKTRGKDAENKILCWCEQVQLLGHEGKYLILHLPVQHLIPAGESYVKQQLWIHTANVNASVNLHAYPIAILKPH